METLDLPTQPLRVQWIPTVADFQPFRASAGGLLERFADRLLDDFSSPEPGLLVENVAACAPWLWLLTDPVGEVQALACLTAVTPGRQGWIHGVSHPATRRHPAIDALAEAVFVAAFERLGLHKLKAEIEADNAGAKGFCRRKGFTLEARLKADNLIGGVWRDVLIYSLFAKDWRHWHENCTNRAENCTSAS